ncbi:MAG: type II secretion system F family protein [Planctomycetaceae bacterium]|nr:type II secretion system F family protein [Planctomycetaceae bacterium]
MAPLILYLLVPTLGILVLIAEALRHNGERQWIRDASKRVVGALGLLITGIAVCGTAFVLVETYPWSVGDESLLVIGTAAFAGCALLALLILTAINAIRVGFSSGADESVRLLAEASRRSGQLQLTAWCLVLAPLLQLGFTGLFVMLPLILASVAIWTARRSRESHFLWTLALAVENDLPLPEEIDAFAVPLWRRTRRRYRRLAERLREGRSLMDGLELGGVLPSSVVAELRAAQAAGTLPIALRAVAARQTDTLLNNRFNGSIAITSVYVWTVLATVFAIVGFLMYWIVPKFKEIFNDFGVTLPSWTTHMIRFADWFLDYFYLSMTFLSLPILVAIGATVVGVVGWGNLNYPLLMRWFPRWDAPGLLRGLAYAVDAKRPLSETLEEMAEHHRRSDVTERLLRMQQLLDGGESLSTVLLQEGYVKPVEAEALSAAARAGNLNWALQTLAESMERTGWHRTQFWLELLKPAAVMLVGCVVMYFVIGFFLPLVKLINELS